MSPAVQVLGFSPSSRTSGDTYRVDGYTDGMVPPTLSANVGHYEDTFRKVEDTWFLANRVTLLPFGGETVRLSHPNQS